MGWWRRYISERKQRMVPHQYELKLDELDARLSHMEDQLRRTRGYVYAKKGLVGGAPEYPLPPEPVRDHAAAEPPEEPQPASKDEVRRQLLAQGRMVPGKPPVHG